MRRRRGHEEEGDMRRRGMITGYKHGEPQTPISRGIGEVK